MTFQTLFPVNGWSRFTAKFCFSPAPERSHLTTYRPLTTTSLVLGATCSFHPMRLELHTRNSSGP